MSVEFRDEHTVASPAAAPDAASVDILTRGGELISFVPANPVEMEFMITELTSLVEQMPGKLLELNEIRYDAERAHSRRRNSLLDHYMATMPATRARARAEVESMAELEAWHRAKAAWHYADDTLKALTSKLNANLNINKGVQAAYNGYGGRR